VPVPSISGTPPSMAALLSSDRAESEQGGFPDRLLRRQMSSRRESIMMPFSDDADQQDDADQCDQAEVEPNSIRRRAPRRRRTAVSKES